MSRKALPGALALLTGAGLRLGDAAMGFAVAGPGFSRDVPLVDRRFGTLHLPRERWPRRYGVVGDAVPEGWLAQLLAPLRRR